MAHRSERATEIARAVAALPPLPAVALRVVEVAQDPGSSAADLATVVSADPGLSAAVLRAANSAAYRRLSEVTSVRQALVVLGFEQARNIAVSSAITRHYAPDALHALFRVETFWRHSIAVAFRAADLVEQARDRDVATAFTAGILHDMGRLAMFYADPAGMDQAVAEAIRRGEPLDAVEHELLGFGHCEVGEALAERWTLPAPVREAIAEHHSNPPEGSLAARVAAADRYCIARGLLPGYVSAEGDRAAGERDEDFERLLARTDGLVELIAGERMGMVPIVR